MDTSVPRSAISDIITKESLMSPLAIHRCAFAGLLFFGSHFVAQLKPSRLAQPGPPRPLECRSNQHADLTTQRVNLQPVIPGVTAVLCRRRSNYDDSGALLKQLAVTNISPATAANLVFKPACRPRQSVRGRKSAPWSSRRRPPLSTRERSLYANHRGDQGLNVMTSLKIIDDATAPPTPSPPICNRCRHTASFP